MPTFKAFKKNAKRKTKKRKKVKFLFFNKHIAYLNPLKGGKAMMYGSVGCIFSPAISCKKKGLTVSEKQLYVSKLMLPNEANREMRIVDEIKSKLVDLNNQYKKYLPILSTYMCNDPNITSEDLENVTICKDVKGFENLRRFDAESFRRLDFKILNMLNVGQDMFEYKKTYPITTTKQATKMLKMISSFIIECIFVLNNHGIFHCDIKNENITYNEKEQCISIIDFGRAIITNNDKETHNNVKELAMDFNILPSVVFFHDDLPSIENELKMREIVNNKIKKSINGGIMVKELSSILSIKEADVTKILSIALYKIYLDKALHLIENRVRYFHEVFKWNIDMWSMFIVMNNIFSGTEYSASIKMFGKQFFEQSFTTRVDQSKIETKLKSLLSQ